MQDKVKDVLDKVRPYLVQDGGNVKVKLVGACAGCPHSKMTLKNGIEKILKQEIPEVKEVVAV
jgi:Fe-S cluster biogenesis protein NfuA